MTNPVKVHYRCLHDNHDSWSSSLNALFDIAEVLWLRDAVPNHWEYRPEVGQIDTSENDFKEFDTKDLVSYGNVLNRYKDYLDKKGLSY